MGVQQADHRKKIKKSSTKEATQHFEANPGYSGSNKSSGMESKTKEMTVQSGNVQYQGEETQNL